MTIWDVKTAWQSSSFLHPAPTWQPTHPPVVPVVPTFPPARALAVV